MADDLFISLLKITTAEEVPTTAKRAIYSKASIPWSVVASVKKSVLKI